jgi:hypothetical protein
VTATLAAERRRTFADRSLSRPRIASPWRLAILAAAVLVAGFFVVRALVPARPDPAGINLGAYAIRFAADYRTVAPGEAIRWHYSTRSDKGPFRVELRGTSKNGNPSSKNIEASSAEWIPNLEQLSDLQDRVRVRVVALDMSGPAGKELGSSPEISLPLSR